ncbi:MAG: DUF167 domain-containing protein [Caulobacteraceae bacterium]
MPPSRPEPLRLSVRVTPRGGRDGIDGWMEDAAGRPLLKVRVASAATDGQANAALIRLLARRLGVPASAVTLISGATSRVKRLEIAGADADALPPIGS